LIAKRDGCHVWKPEDFPPDDFRHGWTWDDCWNDAVALLGGEQAVRDYVTGGKAVEIEPDGPRRTIEIETSPDEPPPFQLVSDSDRVRKQGRLELSKTPKAPQVARPKILDHPDPEVARYLAVVVRIIAAHRRMPPKTILGRKKVEKLVHLIECHLGLDLGRHAVRAAAGPLDMERHKFVCRIAGERGIFLTIEPERHASEDEEVQTPRGEVRFVPAEHFEQALAESSDVFGDRGKDVDRLLGQLMKLDPGSAEVVATLYAAWCDLIETGAPTEDDDIFRAFREWSPEKEKFTRMQLVIELAWMRQEGIVPKE
jgi:hypothetical protein